MESPDQQKKPGTDREVTQPVRYITPGYVFRAFNWKERLKILLGSSVVLEIYFASQHNPGRTHPVCETHVLPYGKKQEREAIQHVQQEAIRKNRIKAPEPKKEGKSHA